MIGHANHDASLPDMMSAHLSDYSWHSNCGACNTCDNLIRPGVWTAASSAYEPDFITAAPQKSQSNVTNMSLVICVMAKLVDRQERQQGSNCCRPRQATPHGTLSQTSHDSAAASHVSQIRAVDTTASDQTPDASSTGQLSDRDGDSEDQFFGILPCWPTPSVTAWDNIQTTVTRAFLTLEWLLRQHSLKADASHAHDSDAQCLMHDIAALIYRLAAGHLLDEKLNMQRVFTSGVLPVLEAWSIYGLKNLDLNTLGQMLLARMTTDATLRSCDSKLDASGKLREICIVQQMAKMFGEHSIFVADHVVCTQCTTKLACCVGCLAWPSAHLCTAACEAAEGL